MGRGLTITAFVLSLLFFIPFVPIIGLILGIIALVKAKDDPNALQGLAIAAVVIGAITTMINIFILIGLFSTFFAGIGAPPLDDKVLEAINR